MTGRPGGPPAGEPGTPKGQCGCAPGRDPRPSVIGRRLQGVGRLIAVTGGKGGIGKSVVASCLALELARAGRRVGLLDLDLTGPCAHLILGTGPAAPREESGLVPAVVHGIGFMSVTCFAGSHPAPLRGADVSSAFVELLSVVQWGALDFLVVDMPPGLGDALLDAVRLLPRAEFLVVATASRVVLETVRRTLALLGEVGARLLGVVENMRVRDTLEVPRLAAQFGVPFLGALPLDGGLETALGDPAALGRTRLARALGQTVGRRLLS
ncbi:MAG: P-loop NTPase [Candidatus Latescibacterota bacterium]